MTTLRSISLAGLIAVGAIAMSALTASGDESGNSPSDAELDSLYDAAGQALSGNHFSESIALYERVAEHRPDDIELFYWLGVAHWGHEDGPPSVRAYAHAVELDPDHQSDWSLYALENMAEVLTRTDRMAESKSAYERSLARETRPEWTTKIENQLAELDLAMGTFEPDESTVFNDRGEVVGGVGLDNMRTNVAFEIARHTQDPVKEAKYYRLAIETDPGMYQSYFNLGLALVKQEKYAEAIPWLEQSDVVWKEDADYNPTGIDKGDAHAFLALCHLEQGDTDRAWTHAELAMAADPGNYWVRLYTQRVKVARGDVAEAIAVLEQMVTDNPEHAETLAALAEAKRAADQAAAGN